MATATPPPLRCIVWGPPVGGAVGYDIALWTAGWSRGTLTLGAVSGIVVGAAIGVGLDALRGHRPDPSEHGHDAESLP